MRSIHTITLVPLLLAAGCYDEGLSIYDLKGEVVLPKAAGTRAIPVRDADGNIKTDASGEPITEEITDVRLIGPVYIGLYPETQFDEFEGYTLPVREPFRNIALPYGGTTIGDLRNACIEDLACRVTSGRFVDFDGMLDWFNNIVGAPVEDAQGDLITVGEFVRQTCFDLLEYTNDAEIRVTAFEDRNDDGEINELDLDFVYDEAEEVFRASFDLLQADFYEGMHVWAYMHTPGLTEYGFDSCNPTLGYGENTYDADYNAGLQFTDILNSPQVRIQSGDWVVSEGSIWTDPESPISLVIDDVVSAGE